MSMNQFTMNDKTELDARSKGLRRTIVKILDAADGDMCGIGVFHRGDSYAFFMTIFCIMTRKLIEGPRPLYFKQRSADVWHCTLFWLKKDFPKQNVEILQSRRDPRRPS